MSGPPLPNFEVDERRFTGDSQQDPKCVAVEGNLVIPEGSKTGEYKLILKDNEKAESETADFFVGNGQSDPPFKELSWRKRRTKTSASGVQSNIDSLDIKFIWKGDSSLRFILDKSPEMELKIPLLAIHKGIMISHSKISLGIESRETQCTSPLNRSTNETEFSLSWMNRYRGKFVHWKQVATARLVRSALRDMGITSTGSKPNNEKLRVLYIGPDDTLNLVTTVQTILDSGADIGVLHIAQSFTGQDDLSSATSSLRGVFEGDIRDHEHAGSGSEYSWKPDNKRKKFDLIVDTYALPWSPLPRAQELKTRLDALKDSSKDDTTDNNPTLAELHDEIAELVNEKNAFTKDLFEYLNQITTNEDKHFVNPQNLDEKLFSEIDWDGDGFERHLNVQGVLADLIDQAINKDDREVLIGIYQDLMGDLDILEMLEKGLLEKQSILHESSLRSPPSPGGQLILVAPRDFARVPFGVHNIADDEYKKLTELNKDLPRVIRTRSIVKGELSSDEQDGSELCRAYRLALKPSILDTETRITEPSQETVLKHGEEPYKSLVSVYTGGRQLLSRPVSSQEMLTKLDSFLQTHGKKCLIVKGSGRSGKTGITADALCHQIEANGLPPTTWISSGKDLARETPSSSDLIVIDDAQKSPLPLVLAKLSEWSSICSSFIFTVNDEGDDEGITNYVDEMKTELENSGFSTTVLDIQMDIIAMDPTFINDAFETIVKSKPTSDEKDVLQGFCLQSDKKDSFFSILEAVKAKDVTGATRLQLITNLCSNASELMMTLQVLGLTIRGGN